MGRWGSGGPLAALRGAHQGRRASREEQPSPAQAAGHVFISYALADTERAEALQHAFMMEGFRVWRDASELWPGEDWRARIRAAISDDALVFIACFSSRGTAQNGGQYEELLLAVDQLRRRPPGVPWLIPVRFDDCQIPDLDLGAGRNLASLYRADLFGGQAGEATARLIEAVRRLLLPATTALRQAGWGTRARKARRQLLFSLGAVVVAAAAATAVVVPRTLARPPATPVQVEVDTGLQTLDEVSFVTQRPSALSPAQLSALDGSAAAGNSAYEAWLRGQGAIPTGPGLIGVTVTGNSPTTVTIEQMEVVKQCASPLAGTLFYNPSAIGGTLPVPTVNFDLDTSVSAGTYLPPPGTGKAPGGLFFSKEIVQLAWHEQRTLEIQVETSAHFCTFTFRMTVATGNEKVTEVIDDNGKSFALTGADNGSPDPLPYSAYQVIYAGGKADPQHNGSFIRVDPERYHGSGDPETYALSS